MMKSPIRTAILGAGASTRVFHAPLIAAAGALFDLAAIGARDPSRAAPVAGVPILPIDAVLADASIALVVVATPPDSHADLATRALAAGKHVVLEKPAAASVAQVDAIAAAAARADRKVAVFHNRRWDSDFLTLRALLDSGRLGEVRELTANWDRWRPQVRDRWRERAAPGGGLWFDLGSHMADQALQLFGPPIAVMADIGVMRAGATVDDYFAVRLIYGERRVVLRASALAAAPAPRFVVHGERGSWVKHGFDIQEAALATGVTPGGDDWGRDPAPGELTEVDDAGTARPSIFPSLAGDYPAFYRGLHAALTADAPLPASLDEGRAVLTLLEAAALSAREGRAIRLDA